jgi:signal transduction histidine kinase
MGTEALPELAIPARFASRIARRDLVVEGLYAFAFLCAAMLCVALLPVDRSFDLGLAAVLVLAFALTFRARLPIGTGYTAPLQLIFVPMLFLEPARTVPLLVLAGWLLGTVPELVRREMHPTRLLLVPVNCWFCVGPAIILALAGDPGPDWGDWPLYLALLASQFAGDYGFSTIDEWLRFGTRPLDQLRVVGWISVIDLLLSPLGLLAAFASRDARFAFLAVLPAVGVMVLFSRERQRRFDAERTMIRQREALVAGASHEMQTPLSVLAGLLARARRDSEHDRAPDRSAYAAMERQVGHLDHLVRQFLDFTALRAGRTLVIRPAATEVRAILDRVAEVNAAAGVTVSADGLPAAHVDPDRLEQTVMSLVAHALHRGSPEGPVTISAWAAGDRVLIEVADEGPAVSADDLELAFDELGAGELGQTGLGLQLARHVMRAQGGDVRLSEGPGGGLVATVELPRVGS